MTVGDTLSVEDVAERTGTSVRTIRFYQAEGLLPAPARHGRQALYGAGHIARLDLIAKLQGRGLRLSAIRQLLEQSVDETTAAEWLGLGESLVRPWADDAPALLTEAELVDQLPGDAVTVDALVRTGLVERRDDTTPRTYLVPSPGLLEVGLELARLGVGPDVAARLRSVLETKLRDAAIALVAAFTAEVSADQLAAVGPSGLAQLLDQLQPITRRAADLLFAHEMERAQRDLVDAAAASLDTDGLPAPAPAPDRTA